ncbi:hypothetical protein GUA87_11060 [Sneathiella sp. P13V-1]|uniref:hypothetical protein n=1 Tax=Sneathiella sp. P13V-1 TaxID=2697366 RepID=UPI00187B33A1|nr:hypothetical protein [Sneathiella sp. P13V-1]MBE7637386.1 hypothetical protein [Sneathiella sp. P13V-1]
MMNVIEFQPDSMLDLYSTAHFMIMQQGENAINLLDEEAQSLRKKGATEELNACLHLLRVVQELIDMEIKGPIH